MDDWQTEVSGDRMVIVTHPDGHRWFFRFPDRWVGGEIPEYDAAYWAGHERPDSPAVLEKAAAVAVERAERERWVVP